MLSISSGLCNGYNTARYTRFAVKLMRRSSGSTVPIVGGTAVSCSWKSTRYGKASTKILDTPSC